MSQVAEYSFILILVSIVVLVLLAVLAGVLSHDPAQEFERVFNGCIALESFTREECILYASERVG